jgi:molecular chaperone DnaK (HSP70)
MLTYDLSNPEDPKVMAWGYSSTSSMNTFTWFKLGLGKDQAQNENDDQLLYEGLGSIKCPENMTFKKLATDYLTKLYEHFKATMEKQTLGATYKMLKFRFVLAVPAGWPDRDRQLIKDCAVDAGFGKRGEDDVIIIEEPEAAALATLHCYGSRFQNANALKVCGWPPTAIVMPSN